jgi:hypothetical protein
MSQPLILERTGKSESGISSIPDLVSEGWILQNRINADTDRLKQIKGVLIKAGGGKHYGARGGEALVIFPSPKIAPPKDQLGAVQDALGKDDFTTLFEKIISWVPVKSCRDVAMRVLPTAKLKKFLALCEVECSPQVRFG